MVWRIARHEWRLLVRSPGACAVACASLLLIVVATVSGHVRASAEADDRATLRDWAYVRQSALAGDLDTGEPGDAADVAWGPRSAEYVANEIGTYVVPPMPPLAALAIGQSDRYPSHYRVTARLRESRLTGAQLEHPLAMLVGHLDAAFVVVYLLPLLIVALVFDVTAGERDAGTLRMVMARPVRPSTFVAGKLIARGGVVLLCIGAMAVGGAAVTAWSVSTGVRLSLWMAATIAYASFWFALALFVDARRGTAIQHAQILGVAWLLLVVLVPASIDIATGAVHAPPSDVELSTAVRTASHAADAASSRLLGRFLDDHPASGVGRAGMQQYAAVQEARELETARLLAPALARFDARSDARRALLAWLQYLSPAMLTQATLADIAGAGPARQRIIYAQVETFHEQWKRFFSPYLREATPLGADDHAAIPVALFREEGGDTVARHAVVPIAGLTVVGILLATAARRRYVADTFAG